jgi:NADH:ubiquinone oxidoreductase subunit 6 (subunit J)
LVRTLSFHDKKVSSNLTGRIYFININILRIFFIMFSWNFLTLQFIYIFYFLILFSSICIVSLNNPVQSILYLILVFIITSFLFILYNFTFLGLILMIVYLGAVVVLFLFIVMLLNIKVLELRRIINFYPFLFLLISFFFFFYINTWF